MNLFIRQYKETEEIYLRARYYQPAVGRFLTRDTYTGEEDEPLSLHLHGYCGNDGVNAWDPSGHDAIWLQYKGGAGGAGHTGALLQDSYTKKWFYFYWGPAKRYKWLTFFRISVPYDNIVKEIFVNTYLINNKKIFKKEIYEKTKNIMMKKLLIIY